MAVMESFFHLAWVSPCKLTKDENKFLQTEIFIRIYDELKEYFKAQHQDYFDLMKFDAQMENAIMEGNFFRCLIKDILSTEEYSLSGIAYYTHSSEEVIYDVVIGLNTNPSLSLARKIIELHRSIRPELYRAIVAKIVNEYSKSGSD